MVYLLGSTSEIVLKSTVVNIAHKSTKVNSTFSYYVKFVKNKQNEERMIIIIAQRIRELREQNNKKQTEIAELLNTKQTVYSRYELNKTELPTHHLMTLCEYYNVSPEYILGYIDEQKELPKRK